LQGSEALARDLIAAAALEVFDRYWDVDELEPVVQYFAEGGVLQISDTAAAELCWRGLSQVPGLQTAVDGAGIVALDSEGERVAAGEFLLEGLAAHRKISRAEGGSFTRARPERPRKGPGGGMIDKDLFG
jgi:magnesium chelatase subunit I